MFIFGGYDGQSWLNDFYSLNLTNLRWTKIENNGESPSERFGFASGIFENKMFLFGGFDGNT